MDFADKQSDSSCGENQRSGVRRVAARVGFLVSLLAALPAPTLAQDGGVEVFAAGPLFSSGSRVSLTHIYETSGRLYRGSNRISDPLDREQDAHRVVLGFDHGLRPDFTVSALVPWVAIDLDSDAGDSDSSGLGDVSLLGKYRFYQRNWPRSTFNLAVIGGVETPTGTTSQREGGLRLPPGQQPGSGSWDPFLALSSNLSQGRYRLDAGAFYKLNTEGAQDFDRGNFFSFSLDSKYRFLLKKYPGPTAGAKLGVQYRYEGRAEQNGANVSNSGYSALRGRTGLTWHPAPNIDVSFVIEIPLYQSFKGEQLGLDHRTFLAIGLRF